MDKKLYRDPQNGMIAGVCAGVAEYFGSGFGWAGRCSHCWAAAD